MHIHTQKHCSVALLWKSSALRLKLIICQVRKVCVNFNKFILKLCPADGGQTENIFNLTESELSNRVVDLIDVVKDQDQNYVADEDLTTFISNKTARGPLDQDWLETYSRKCVGKPMPTRYSIP